MSPAVGPKTNMTTEHWEEMKQAMVQTAKNLPGNIKNAVRDSCYLIQIRAQTHHLAGTTLKYHTHFLQKSVKTQVIRVGVTNWIGYVGASDIVAYGAIHEYGGKIKRKLKNSKYITITIPKRPWLSNSAKDSQSAIGELFGRVVEVSIP